MGQYTDNRLKIVRLIRHGESLANAGEPSDDPHMIGLTALGYQQAQRVADSFIEPPDLIIHSPMVRATLTARPTIECFPDVPVLQMDIREFTYLDPVRCKGTTPADRKIWVDEYWRRSDIDYHDDGWIPGMSGESRCESFLGFATRVQSFVRQLEVIDGRERIAVFGHGQHIARVQVEMSRSFSDERFRGEAGFKRLEADMRVFPSLLKSIHLENAGSCYRVWDRKKWLNHKPGGGGW